MSEHETLIGKVLQDRYRIDAELGEGGMGSVYRAEHLALGRTVAVKVLRDALAANDEFQQRFEREAKVLSGLSHPNIVSVLDYGFEDELPFLVMEFLEGQDFDEVLARGRLEVDRADAIARQLLRAVGHAHSLGLVHRDLKPQNVVIRTLQDGSEHVTVLDFGLARQVEGGATMTKTGLLMGTPAYMSPEQAAGGKSDARSDVYSLGVMLYEMFGGRHPFADLESVELLRAHLLRDPPPLGHVGSIEGPVVGIVERAMAKEPSDRFADAGAMLKAMGDETLAIRVPSTGDQETVRGAKPVSGAQVSATAETRFGPQTPSQGGKEKQWALAIGAALTVAVLGGIALAIFGDDEAAPRPDIPSLDPAATADTAAAPTTSAAAPAIPNAPSTPTAEPPAGAATPAAMSAARESIWSNASGYGEILARLRRGQSLRRRAHRSLAVQVRRNPNDVRPLLLLAHSYVLGRSLTDGLERYEAALALDPSVAGEDWTAEDLITIAAAESLHHRASALILQHYDKTFATRVLRRAESERGPWRRRLEDLASRIASQ